MTISIASAALDVITAHAREAYPEECCGLLIGDEHLITEAVRTSNIASDRRRGYEVDPAEHVAQLRRCRGTAVGVIGAYHSHPRSAPVPSPTDREQAFEQFLFVIAGPADDSTPLQVRAYRLHAGEFAEVALIRLS